MTPALYKSLLILKEIRVMLLQRLAHFSRPKDPHLCFFPLKANADSSPQKRAQNELIGYVAMG
jgi:hypothetical protein